MLDGCEVPKGRDGHKYGALFSALPNGTRVDITTRVHIDGRPGTEPEVFEVLKSLERTFETWRYLHEGNSVPFNENNLANLFAAVQASIIETRPDFRPWPGVTWEGRDFT